MTNFFGYGSLVNLQTHKYLNPYPTEIEGWRREWVSSSIHNIAFLSVTPCKFTILQGMRASTESIGWQALDLRETGYKRHDLTQYDMQMYIGDPAYIDKNIKKPILLSYLDCVIQGFYQHFGREGVAAFFQTTNNWDHPILDDRNSPQYPRSTILSEKELNLVNKHLENL
jgi:hypothetical protein